LELPAVLLPLANNEQLLSFIDTMDAVREERVNTLKTMLDEEKLQSKEKQL
jgi:hypothetical protein